MTDTDDEGRTSLQQHDSGAGESTPSRVLASPVPRTVGTVIRAVPFTAAIVFAMLLLGVVTTALWRPLIEQAVWVDVAYGLPNLIAGRWWTPVSGAPFAATPLEYLAVVGVFAVLVGWSEWRLGTARVAMITVGGHLTAVLGAALVLALLGGTASDWDWAARVAADLDVGLLAGALAAAAAASATLLPPWRGRLRFVITLYVVIAFLYVGLLADLEYLIGTAIGLVAGPVLLGRRPAIRWQRFSRREWRLMAAALFLVAAVIRLVVWLVPADGPLGSSDSGGGLAVLTGAAISLLLAEGLRRGRRTAWRWAMALTLLAFAMLGLLVVLLVWAAASDPDEITLLVSDTRGLPAAVVDLLLWVVQLVVLVRGRAAFRALSPRVAARTYAETAQLRAADRAAGIALLRRVGGGSLSWMGTWPANTWFVLRDDAGDAVAAQAYQIHRGVAVALGDPVAADATTRERVLDAFVDTQEDEGRDICLFSVSDDVVAWSVARGFPHVQVAEEAIVDLPGLEFKGKQWQTTRSALNRAKREGVRYVECALADQPLRVVAQVRAITEVWVGDKGLPEMGFTLGGVDEALDPAVRCGLAIDEGGLVHGVTSWLPVFGPDGTERGWTLDVMRRRPDGFPPVTEFLIASACLSFRDQGAAWLSLSGAPLARSDTDAALGGLDRLLDRIGELLEPLYGFGSLDAFKRKFQPRHVPLAMVFRDEASLPRIGLALTEAYLPDATTADLARAGLDTIRGDQP